MSEHETMYGRVLLETDEADWALAAKNLPDGWLWAMYYDGSGSLRGPGGERFFEYDLQVREMKDYDGSWSGCTGLDEGLLDRLEQQVRDRHLVTAGRDEELLRAGCWPAYRAGVVSTRNPECTHVAVSPDAVVERMVFDEWVERAHRLETENRSDHTASERELAGRAAGAVKRGDGHFEYEWDTFDVSAVFPAERLLRSVKQRKNFLA